MMAGHFVSFDAIIFAPKAQVIISESYFANSSCNVLDYDLVALHLMLVWLFVSLFSRTR